MAMTPSALISVDGDWPGWPVSVRAVDDLRRLLMGLSNGFASEEDIRQDHDEPMSALDPRAPVGAEPVDQGEDLTLSFVRLANLATCPLDRLAAMRPRFGVKRARSCSRCSVL